MSPELIGIILAAAAIAGLILRQGSQINSGLDKLNERMANFETRMNNFETRMNNFEQRLSRLEATLETLFRLRAIPPLDPSPSNDPDHKDKTA